MFRRKTPNLQDEAEREIPAPPRHFGRTLFNLLTATLVIAAIALFAFGSQKYHGFPENMDSAFLDDAVLPAQPVSAEIFPLVSGQKQRFQITSDPNTPELLNKITQVKEQNGTKLAVMQTKYKDKLVSVRAYAATPKGLMLLVLGGSEPLRFEPPLPLTVFPIKSGAVYSWQGKLTGKKTKMSASALVRIGGAETLTQGKFKRLAYRLDMLIVAKDGDKVNRQQTTLWLTPGIGLVREQSMVDSQTFICEHKSDPLPH